MKLSALIDEVGLFTGETFKETGIPLPPTDKVWYSPQWDEVTGTWVEAKPQTEIDTADDEHRQIQITEYADKLILSKYSELKQRKLMSIAIMLQDKQLSGEVLTTEELAMQDNTRLVNQWISGVRVIENTSIAAGIGVDEIDWSSVEV